MCVDWILNPDVLICIKAVPNLRDYQFCVWILKKFIKTVFFFNEKKDENVHTYAVKGEKDKKKKEKEIEREWRREREGERESEREIGYAEREREREKECVCERERNRICRERAWPKRSV